MINVLANVCRQMCFMKTLEILSKHAIIQNVALTKILGPPRLHLLLSSLTARKVVSVKCIKSNGETFLTNRFRVIASILIKLFTLNTMIWCSLMKMVWKLILFQQSGNGTTEMIFWPLLFSQISCQMSKRSGNWD